MNRLVGSYARSLSVQESVSRGQARSFFVHDVIRSVMLPESELVGTNKKLEQESNAGYSEGSSLPRQPALLLDWDCGAPAMPATMRLLPSIRARSVNIRRCGTKQVDRLASTDCSRDWIRRRHRCVLCRKKIPTHP